MRLKVKTNVDLTPVQQEELQQLGCEATPFISWPHELIFAATCTSEQGQALQQLHYVTSVKPMPTYSVT